MRKLFKKPAMGARFIWIASFLILLSGCVTAEQQMLNDGYKPLTNDELNALFSTPKKMRWTLQSMEQGDVELLPDKTATISRSGGVDYGTWRAVDDRLCINWERLRASGEQCNILFQVEENKFKVFPPSGRFFMVTIE